MPLRGGETVPSDGLGMVLRYAFAVRKPVAQAELSPSKPLLCCEAFPSDGLGMVLTVVALYVLSGCIPLRRCKT